MDRVWGTAHYTSHRVKGIEEGYEGYELVRREDGRIRRVASVIFWDANGQYWVQTFDADVPLDILEDLIAETKENVKFK